MDITFEQLPKAVSQLFSKLEDIEKLLQENRCETQVEADELLTIQQAANFLSLAVPTIYGLVSRSEIPVSKKGKRLYFSKHELTGWIKGGRKRTHVEIAEEAAQFISRKTR